MHAESNEAAERTIIGKIIRGEAIASQIQKQGITPEHFIHYRPLYLAVVEFAASGGGTEIDFITRLNTLGKLDAVGGAANITSAVCDSIGAHLPLAVHALKTAHGANLIQSAAHVLATEPNNAEALAQVEVGRAELTGIERSQSKRLPLISGVNSFPTDPEPQSVLVGHEAIRLGDIAFLNSGAGMGKSVSMGQMAMAWGLGLPYFGIRPSRPLRILHYVGEDDDATMGQIREGFLQHSLAITGRKLSAKDLNPLAGMVATQFDRSSTGDRYLAEIRLEMEAFRPDMVFINPLLSFIGGEIVATAPLFLRGGIMPLLKEYNCAALIAHHTCKLTKTSWEAMDMAYSGIGGSEVANIPRIVFTIAPADDSGMIRLTASKRTTVGWKDEEGKHKTYAFFRRTDDPTRPAWLPVSYEEAEVGTGHTAAAKRKCSVDDVMRILENGDRLKSAVIDDLMKMRNCSDKTALKTIRETIEAGTVREYDGEKPERGGSAPKWLSCHTLG